MEAKRVAAEVEAAEERGAELAVKAETDSDVINRIYQMLFDCAPPKKMKFESVLAVCEVEVGIKGGLEALKILLLIE